ncbi:MAG: hypothetical protein H6748_07420 [Spirochaetaceae bacterium]|nr:hypothetical protein [Spirochaetaceae bacterium]
MRGGASGGDGASADRVARPTLGERLLDVVLEAATAILGRLPRSIAPALGAGIGRLWFALRAPRVSTVETQLARALPELDAARRREIARGVFVHLGRALVETLLLRGRHRQALLDAVEIEGLEHLRAAERASPSGGVLVVTAHYGSWELAAAKIPSLGIPVAIVHRARASRVLDRVLRGLRTDAGADDAAAASTRLIPMGPRAGFAAARALAEGRKLLVLMDQNARREEGLFVDFFGRPACTRSGPLLLAARQGVPVVPAFVRRAPDGRRHRVRVGPALALESTRADGGEPDDAMLRRDLQRLTDEIERAIREDPSQWIWTHRRWRTRPRPDEAGPGGRRLAPDEAGPG